MRTLLLMNVTILTGGDGIYSLKLLSLEEARNIVAAYRQADAMIRSAVGHESTARVMSSLLGIDVPMCRDAVVQTEHEDALCLKMNGRPPEGKILSIEELTAIGFEWYLMRKLPENSEREAGAQAALESLAGFCIEQGRRLRTGGMDALRGKGSLTICREDPAGDGTQQIGSELKRTQTHLLNIEDLSLIRRALRERSEAMAVKTGPSKEIEEIWQRGSKRCIALSDMFRVGSVFVDSGIALIMEERQRQIDVEGFTPLHDEQHAEGELLKAALHILAPDFMPWPWGNPPTSHESFDKKRRWVVAGALIVAEIDRLQGQAGRPPLDFASPQ
jgi:hypothetical protein